MTKSCPRVLFFIMISVALMVGCSAKEPKRRFKADDPGRYGADRRNAAKPADMQKTSGTQGTPASSKTSQSPDSFVLNPDKPEMGRYMRVHVNDFIVIIDASGSKYLPYSGKVKLRIAKDIVRRLNQNTPDRQLFGGLRRYGYEAGAWSVPTALIYGMTDYSRPAFGSSIETVRWAGGKSPMALSINKASDDFQQAKGHYLALVIVSDGRIYQGDPLEATRRIKQRYGDRLCIYTALVGDLPFGRDLLKRAADIGECGYMITSDALESPDTMRDWADDIFHRGQKAKPLPPPPPPRVVRAEPPRRDPCKELDEALRLVVQFDLNKWKIKSEFYDPLNRIAELMAECTHAEVEIHGHTCNIWTEKYNMKLSHMRATEVMKYLVKRGVVSSRLRVAGHGFETPAATNRTEHGRESNRRATFKRLR